MNRELGTDFDLDAFEHLAVWVEDQSRIEMHLVSKRDQVVHVGDENVHIEKGEHLTTEFCHKYTLESFADLAATAGLRSAACGWIPRSSSACSCSNRARSSRSGFSPTKPCSRAEARPTGALRHIYMCGETRGPDRDREATMTNNNLASIYALIVRALNALSHPFALYLRIWVSWVFLHSGWLKIQDWGQTLSLFESEYRVPLLPPHAAAVVGTFGELFFPIFVILGLAGRLSALGLFAVNALAVISYAHVLSPGRRRSAGGQHYLWGLMLLVIVFYGPGASR